jgi:hypothetical protein
LRERHDASDFKTKTQDKIVQDKTTQEKIDARG